MINLVSTYRLQFNKNFTLKYAEEIIPYLHQLGIKTIYASPIFAAAKGSNHGYDIINPLRINPEIGDDEDFDRLINKVHELEMGWIQDIVPNHMAFSIENPWIYDILEKGKNSEYYEFFDIIEDHPDPELSGKLMLPFFGKPLNELVNDKELKITHYSSGFFLKYFDIEYPLSVPAYKKILEQVDSTVWTDQFEHAGDIEKLKYHLAEIFKTNIEFKAKLNDYITALNGNQNMLLSIVDELYYYPCFWKETESRINYRRFFTINGLICLNIQNKKVFDHTHQLIKDWISKGLIDGLRVDHIDGLYNPTEYLERLRQLTGEDICIYVEKILEKDETLPTHWPIEGSTGYDLLALVNNLLTNMDTGPVFKSFYNDWIKREVNYDEVFYKNNRFILYKRLAGELDNLTRRCLLLPPVIKHIEDYQKVRGAIGEFLVACPVYKVYRSPSQFTEYEINIVKMIGEAAIKKNPDNKHALNILVDLFLLKLSDSNKHGHKIDYFFRRCMQFAGPLMAKGIEDTAFYSFIPFIGHNEVGDSPSYFGINSTTFHHAMEERLTRLPFSLNAVSTHDTKRGEDARTRLNVLSDMPVKWMYEAKKWRDLNRKHKKNTNDREIPTANDEYFIYQVLCAHLPMNAKADDSFKERLNEYFIKAIREAKENSSWSNPDEEYESKLLNFMSDILSSKSSFPARLAGFMEEIIPHGLINSITQLILKNTVPGIPDTFQGTEYWNLSFVDPDNRKPVNFSDLAVSLKEIQKGFTTDPMTLARNLFEDPFQGKLKQWVTWLTLKERKQFPELFNKGTYQPLKVIGKFHKRVLAFYRQFQKQHMIVIVPLSTATLEGDNLWEDTQIRLPQGIPSELRSIFTEQPVEAEKTLHIDELFDIVPFAVLRNYPE